MRENTTNDSLGSIEIIQLGSGDVRIVQITSEEMTIKDAFSEAGMSFPENRDVLCNGSVITGNEYVDDGDVYQVVAEKVQAGK